MSDTPCTCQASHQAAGAITINTTPAPPVADLDPVVLDRVVSQFTAAAADAADVRMQALEARVSELEQVVAALLSDWSESSMQDMPV